MNKLMRKYPVLHYCHLGKPKGKLYQFLLKSKLGFLEASRLQKCFNVWINFEELNVEAVKAKKQGSTITSLWMDFL